LRPRTLAAAVSLAAAAAAFIITLLNWPFIAVALHGGSRLSVRTGIGETRTLTLPDGSLISASADTSLVATLLKHSRTVVLQRGEAFFRVKRDPAKPFAVRVDRAIVTDIGTAFDVRRTLGGVVVAVAEGVVRVSTNPQIGVPTAKRAKQGSSPIAGPDLIQLRAGQRLTLESFGTMSELTDVNPEWVAGWRQGRLRYVDEPLKEVVADLARYSTRHIVLADPKIGNLHVTGVVFVRSIDSWLVGLQATFPIRVEQAPHNSVLIEPQ
jgi:transmembrane sensor